MTVPIEFPFVSNQERFGPSSLAPHLPIRLSRAGSSLETMGLLDTRAAISVLPFDLGIQLGANWSEQTQSLQLSGNLATFECRAIVLTAMVGNFEPVRLGFAWSSSPDVPLLLGQVNFFQEFDVCFFRTRAVFEVRPSQSAS